MNEKEFRSYLNRPPRSQHYGNQLSPKGSSYPVSDPPPIQNESPQPHLKVHLRETLKTGQIHYEQPLSVAQKKVSIFIDDRPSLKLLISDDCLQNFESLLKTWSKKHQLSLHIFKSSELKTPWCKEGWQAWYKKKKLFSANLTLTISDFCGDEPEGSFWTYLIAQTDCQILRLEHEEPDFSNGKAVRDINRPKQEAFVWNDKVFTEKRKKWEESIERILRSSAVRSISLKQPDEVGFIKEALRLLTI